jgi:hypothetical protein
MLAEQVQKFRLRQPILLKPLLEQNVRIERWLGLPLGQPLAATLIDQGWR